MTWTPLGIDPAERTALVEGVPKWMHPVLEEAIGIATPITAWSSGNLFGVVGTSDFADFEAASRIPGVARALTNGFVLIQNNPEQILAVLDWLIAKCPSPDHPFIPALSNALAKSGSAWKVGTREGAAGLERRMPQGVQEAAAATMENADSAGQLLSEAWHAAFGRNPNPNMAYMQAVKAVEEAGAKIVSPKNKRTSLGTMLSNMRDQKDWAIPLDCGNPAVAISIGEALWTGQARHAGDTDRGHSNTQEQAETAVLLAVPLVQWFSSGALVRRPAKP